MTQEAPREEPRDLLGCLQGVEDPRIDRTREHELIDILVIGICCLICGGEGFTDMETFGKAIENSPANALVKDI